MKQLTKKLACVFSLCAWLLISMNNANADEPIIKNETLPLSSIQIQRLHALLQNSNSSYSFMSLNTLHNLNNQEHIVWDRTPMTIRLPIGKERMITFPSEVTFGYDTQALPSNLLRVQNANGTLYLLAKSAFPTQRVLVKVVQTGELILLNLSATKAASDAPINIVVPSELTQTHLDTTKIIDTQNNRSEFLSVTNNAVGYVTLMRFAVHQLYAPLRLLSTSNSIYRTPMHTHKTVPLFRDGSVMAMPLASWRSGYLTVTAILLRNQLHQSLTLDPRTLCGHWQAVSFFPRTVLTPLSTPTDSTTVFVIANQSFGDIMHECINGV